jgi:hypothetical protein
MASTVKLSTTDAPGHPAEFFCPKDSGSLYERDCLAVGRTWPRSSFQSIPLIITAWLSVHLTRQGNSDGHYLDNRALNVTALPRVTTRAGAVPQARHPGTKPTCSPAERRCVTRRRPAVITISGWNCWSTSPNCCAARWARRGCGCSSSPWRGWTRCCRSCRVRRPWSRSRCCSGRTRGGWRRWPWSRRPGRGPGTAWPTRSAERRARARWPDCSGGRRGGSGTNGPARKCSGRRRC